MKAGPITRAGKNGKAGELAVVAVVPCPHCKSKLMPLPPGFPLFDVQCTRCMFRAQIKTLRCAPLKDQIFGAGWDILEKTLKSGHLIPPLLVNFQWSDEAPGKNQQEVYFFPFLTLDNLKRRQRSNDGAHPNYKEFNYVGLLTAPHIRLFPPKSTTHGDAKGSAEPTARLTKTGADGGSKMMRCRSGAPENWAVGHLLSYRPPKPRAYRRLYPRTRHDLTLLEIADR